MIICYGNLDESPSQSFRQNFWNSNFNIIEIQNLYRQKLNIGSVFVNIYDQIISNLADEKVLIPPTLKAQITPDLKQIRFDQKFENEDEIRDDLTNNIFAVCSVYMNEQGMKFYNEGITKAAFGLRIVLQDEEMSFWSLLSLIE